MIDINYTDYAYEAYMKLSYSEVDDVVAFLKSFEREDLPETIREEILPKMEDFLADNY